MIAEFQVVALGTQVRFLFDKRFDEGIAEAYAAAVDETARDRLSQEVKRLTFPGQMGEAFQVIRMA